MTLTNQHEGKYGILCKGTLARAEETDVLVSEYIRDNNEYNGVKITIEDISDYKYLVVFGKKIADCGQPSIFILILFFIVLLAINSADYLINSWGM